jgi:hypothetical protein
LGHRDAIKGKYVCVDGWVGGAWADQRGVELAGLGREQLRQLPPIQRLLLGQTDPLQLVGIVVKHRCHASWKVRV